MVKLLLMGKTKQSFVEDGMLMYLKRIKKYIKCEVVEIPELKGVKSWTVDDIKNKEAELFLKHIKNDPYILLDERGKEFSSITFSKYLEKQLSHASGTLYFLVGGAYGFQDELKRNARGLVSLSKMTFSHQIIRAVFLEQLYRAFSILKGDPYHNEG